ncbi:hypothetical protein MITS9509_03541 [Synechococcus sp. MIT S9509]|uniref:hypothetical protein n=1 Tax=unclassified Synechococcus TaxID=2626047 RepID=UPI0007BC01EC|nr:MULTISPECIES: hypothetical protein [unclassified Synechococcus]KZR80700.1 hypothetical protein MITS9504_03542 [Synechococcus sp. MIT S9504]KZR85782.1 hypothetical protein MITS9509_03541 [Synechococcus sp. MIT S9509]
MTPEDRKIVREALLAAGKDPSTASNANPWSKTGAVAMFVQDFIGKNHPVRAAHMRREHNPDGLSLDAQCVLDKTLNPEEVLPEVLQNLYEFEPKYTKHLINQQKAAFDARVASGDISMGELIQLEEAGDPRAAELQSKAEAQRAQQKANQATAEAALAMQSREQTRQQAKAEAISSGRVF